MDNKIKLEDCKTPEDYILWQSQRLNEASDRELELLDQIKTVFKFMQRERKKPLSEDNIANLWVLHGIKLTGPEFVKVVRIIEKAHGIE